MKGVTQNFGICLYGGKQKNFRNKFDSYIIPTQYFLYLLTKSTIEMSNKTSPYIGYVIGTTRRLILKVLGAEFIKHQIPITIEQYIFLHTLRSMEGDVTQQDMANHTCKDKSAVLRTIDILEKQDLVKRSQVAGDRRKNTISPTEKCNQLFNEIFELEEKIFSGLTQGISNEDYDTAIKVLRQIQQNANTLPSGK